VDVDGFHLFTALDPAALKSIARATRGAYYPAAGASELNHAASTIRLRLTVQNQRLPLAGAFIALAVVLFAAGSVLTVIRSGRVI
jgi:Ca-activated chloride channel family protein